MSPSASKRATSGGRAFAIDAARLASDLKCTDVSVLDMRGRSPVCDYMVIASGTSQRQMKSVAQELSKHAKSSSGAPWRVSADEGSSWIVADFVDVVVHLFEPSQRAWYDLEGLWSDAPHVDWESGSDDEGTTVPARPKARRAAR